MPELTVLPATISSPSRLRSRKRKLSSVNGYTTDPICSFWGITLTEDNPEVEWNMREDEADEEFGSDRDYMLNQLSVKGAALGHGLLKNQEQVVEVETLDMNLKPLKIPIVNMAAGLNSMMNMDLEFTDKYKVIFRLKAGSGPVHLYGSCYQEHPDDEIDSQDESLFTETETTATDENTDSEELGLEEEEDEDEEEEEEMRVRGKGQKRKSPSKKTSKPKQRSKLESKEESEESEESDEEDDEDDEEEEMDTGSKKKGRPSVSPKPGKNPKGRTPKKSPGMKVDKKKAKKGKAK